MTSALPGVVYDEGGWICYILYYVDRIKFYEFVYYSGDNDTSFTVNSIEYTSSYSVWYIL